MTVRKSQWVWHRKWTLVRFMFTISRYLPFVGIGMTFTAHAWIAALRTQYYPGESIWTSVQRLACTAYRKLEVDPSILYSVLHVICILAAEGLLLMRIYTSWPCKRLLTFLIVFPTVCLVGSYILSHSTVVDNYLNTPTNLPDLGQCLFVNGRKSVFEYAALFLCELDAVTHAMILTLYQVVSSFNIILNMALPITWVAITDDPQVVIHSVLASRLLFNLRESEERSRTRPTLVEVSDIQFELSASRFGAR
ncbi:hypothetical protein DFH29DRAFT_1074501 [Suillus ampliporus]|nr:hypothetical protein DFH29DRAFT_1074501 [Suillus ampliporus]